LYKKFYKKKKIIQYIIMNKVILIGNLTKDPEIKVTSTGKKVASFSLAINDGKDASGQDLTSYFNCSAWEKVADVIEKYVKKGHKIMASGKLKNRSWDKPDGTKAYATDILVSEVEMLTSKVDAERINSMAGSDSSSMAPASAGSSTKKSSKATAQDDDFEDTLPEIDINSIKSQMPF
jgi:single-strand DNA-binding protein